MIRIARAIEEGRGDFDEQEIGPPWQEALGLLDALFERTISGYD